MGTDRNGLSTDGESAGVFPRSGSQSSILETIVRGVQDFQIPASTSWPAAKQHLADDAAQWKFSAVLVAIVSRDEPTVLLTQRSSGLSEYSAHVSFPGGRPEASDPDVGTTALREAFEEIGLAPDAVQLTGCLPLHKTRKRNHAIFPVVGIVSDTATWKAAPAGVDEIFEFPFSALLNPDLPRQYVDGERAGAWYWAEQEHDVWGVTAFILRSLAGLAPASRPGGTPHRN